MTSHEESILILLDLPIQPLTPTQRLVAACCLRQLSYRQMGDELHMSPGTAKHHVRDIAAKLRSRPGVPQYKRVAAWAVLEAARALVFELPLAARQKATVVKVLVRTLAGEAA